MKNLGLADKLKEARGELTGMFHNSTSFEFLFTGLTFLIKFMLIAMKSWH